MDRPTIFISQFGKLGGKATMVSAVGDDNFGKLNLERLKKYGVDISAISIDSDYPTRSAFVRYRKDGSLVFVFNITQSAADRFGWTLEVSALIHRLAIFMSWKQPCLFQLQEVL